MNKFDLGKLLIENKKLKEKIAKLLLDKTEQERILKEVYDYWDVENEGVPKEQYVIIEKIRRFI